jgi:hypothetical protein
LPRNNEILFNQPGQSASSNSLTERITKGEGEVSRYLIIVGVDVDQVSTIHYRGNRYVKSIRDDDLSTPNRFQKAIKSHRGQANVVISLRVRAVPLLREKAADICSQRDQDPPSLDAGTRMCWHAAKGGAMEGRIKRQSGSAQMLNLSVGIGLTRERIDVFP